MTNYRSLVPGGFYSSAPLDRAVPTSIRCNNPGAVNGAAWEQAMPGYVTTGETTPGNKTTIFETPEQGVAVWFELMRRYRAAGATTVAQIVTRYGGGQDYSAYANFVAGTSGLGRDAEVRLDDDKALLPFAKAMFRYEAGKAIPWSDAQIIYGFNLARGTSAAPAPKPGMLAALMAAIARLFPKVVTSPLQKTQENQPADARVVTSVPPWLATMRKITGTKEAPGGADNPTILAWRDEIARRYPDMAPYCRTYTKDSVPWCGLTVAYVMAVNGIRPMTQFLWAQNWAHFGTKLDKPKLGCVMVFVRNGGGHVSLYEGEEGDSYLVRGGNQSDQVNVTKEPKSHLIAAVWPAGVSA